LLAIVVLAAALFWLICYSPVFVVRAVQVTGVAAADPAAVLQAAGLIEGQSIVRLDVAAVEERVEQLPIVASARVDRDLNGTVTIALTERQPIYAIAQTDGYQLVDSLGVAYLSVVELPTGLPVVSVGDGESDASIRLRADAATIVACLPEAVLLQLQSLTATTPDDFTLTLTTGSTVLWGSAEQSELKATVVEALIKTPASVYDITAPNHPTTR
jgi:cell division protein FtsQ